MTISILICVHSTDITHDNMLLEALESLNHQTYKDFDVFIVFDECWTNTNIIVKDNYNFIINRLYHEKKDGLSVAKNFGLSHINSEWIGYLDADDLYMPDKLLKQVEYIKNNDVDFLSTLAWNKYINSNKLFESCIPTRLFETHEQLYSHIISEGNCLTHGAMIIRKSCLDVLNGYNNIKGVEDWDLWKRALLKGYNFYQLQDRLYVYTIGTSVAR